MMDKERQNLRAVLVAVADLYSREKGDDLFKEDRQAWTPEERINVGIAEAVEAAAEDVRLLRVVRALMKQVSGAEVDTLLDRVDTEIITLEATTKALAERVDLKGEPLRAVCARALSCCARPVGGGNDVILATPTKVDFPTGGGESPEVLWVTCEVGIPLSDIQEAANALARRHAIERARQRRGVMQDRPALLAALGLPEDWKMPTAPREGLVAYFSLSPGGGDTWVWDGWWAAAGQVVGSSTNSLHRVAQIPWPFPSSAFLWEDEITSLGFTPWLGRRGAQGPRPTDGLV